MKTNYLISGNGYATATGLSAMIDSEIIREQSELIDT